MCRMVTGPAAVLAAASVLLLNSCGDAPTGSTSDQIAIIRALPPSGVPGWRLLDTITLLLRSEDGEAMPGVPVSVTATRGGGSVAPLAAATGPDGKLSFLWTLGPAPGLNEVTARTESGASLTLSVTGDVFRVDRLAAAHYHACGLVEGSLWCWGSWVSSPAPSLHPAFAGSAGDGLSEAPGRFGDARDFVDVAVTDDAVCALNVQGVAWCASRSGPASLELTAGLPPLRDISSARGNILGGELVEFCGLAAVDSTLWCWGRSGAAAVPGSPALIAVGGDRGLLCGLRSDSTAVCWGGPLGEDSGASSGPPVAIAQDLHFARLAVGGRFACGLTQGGRVWCWGVDGGSGAQAPLLEPAVQAKGVGQITAGGEMAMVLNGGKVEKWIGARSRDTGPAYLLDLTGLDGLSVADLADGSTACVRLSKGEVHCWDEIWAGNSTVPHFADYVPVQPVIGETEVLDCCATNPLRRHEASSSSAFSSWRRSSSQ